MDGIRYLRLDFLLFGGEVPFFTGSALRGAFGHSLKKVCCINPKVECEGCFADSTCLYYEFFEERGKSHRYRFCIEVPAASWGFGIYLYEEACDKTPYVVTAIDMAINEFGLGKERQKPHIVSVTANGVSIYDAKNYNLKEATTAIFQPTHNKKISAIKLKTPFRLRSDGKMAQKEEITALSAALSAMRRYDELKGSGFVKRHYEYDKESEQRDIKFVNLERYSTRQQTKMALGGYMGEIECADMPNEMNEALQIGEIIGVGKSCVFGLGEIKLEEERE